MAGKTILRENRLNVTREIDSPCRNIVRDQQQRNEIPDQGREEFTECFLRSQMLAILVAVSLVRKVFIELVRPIAGPIIPRGEK